MSYQSPLHIIKGLATETDFQINDTNLIRLRKQLLAELNLSGETTITVNKKQYSKDEIIKTIDLLLNNPNLDVHEFIYNNLFLLKYLEDDSLTLNTNLYSKLEISETIKGKLENIIYDRFIVQFKKGMSVRNFANAEGALILMNTLTDNYKNECYEEVHKSLYTFSNYILEIEANIDDYKKDDLKFLTYQTLALFLNRLPEEFDDLKNEITVRIINLVVAYHRLSGHSTEITKGISTMLLKINCEEEHSKLIRNNHKVFSNTSSSSSSSETAPWRIIIFVIIVLVNVLRMGRGCSNNKSNDNFQYSNNNSFNALLNQQNKNETFNYQFDSYKNKVLDKFKSNGNFNSTYKPSSFNTGSRPYSDNYLFQIDTSYSLWEHKFNIINKTNNDLIVFICDSLQKNYFPIYINKYDAFQVNIPKSFLIAFYFGNNFLSPQIRESKIKEINELYNSHFRGFFADNNQTNIDLLCKTYKFTLSKQKSKKIKPVKCTLDLDSTFITNQKSKYEFKKYSLTQVEENNY